MALALLGLLNIGSETIFADSSFNLSPRVKPIYWLIDSDWALPVITFCYTFVNVASMVSGSCHSR